ALVIDYTRHPEALARDLVDDLRHRRAGLHDWGLITTLHQLFGAHQSLTELSAWMQTGEVLLAESLGDQQRHRDRVAEGQRGGGAGRGNEVHRAGFLGDTAVQGDVCGLRQRGAAIPRDRDEAGTKPLDRLEQTEQFV